MEANLRRGDSTVGTDLQALSAAHGRLMRGLAAMAAPVAAALVPPANPAACAPLLRDLMQRLERSDASSSDAFRALKSALGGQPTADLRRLEGYISRYEFEQAGACARELATKLQPRPEA